MVFYPFIGFYSVLCFDDTYTLFMVKNVLEIDSVLLKYRERVILRDIYFKSETGRVTAILGRNGTGKSCLMKILIGTISPQEKFIRINDQNLLSSSRLP